MLVSIATGDGPVAGSWSLSRLSNRLKPEVSLLIRQHSGAVVARSGGPFPIAMVTIDTNPGSVLVRALVETARPLRLDEVLVQDPLD